MWRRKCTSLLKIDTLAEVDIFLPNEVELAGITGFSDPEQALRALENGRTGLSEGEIDE